MGLSFLSGTPPAVTAFAKVGLVVFGCLSGVSILASAWRGIEWTWGLASKRRANVKRRIAAEKSLDDLTKRERDILAFLVTNGERHFTTAMDGGFAAGLIGRGLIHRALRPGQAFDGLSTPFTVDEDVWEALQKRKDEFKHPKPGGRPPYIDSMW
ncbi:hypothetical protein [Nitratireductor sp.]|uniref:hypothetical protein n=1 Tax=Nitratireductor sp. TaxID=1872084 RepID=UPI00260973BB|nr:hypothetical protein [Nitratireductor sp.]MCV0381547.1 hypothetical protein [Nitratireductor sp.]